MILARMADSVDAYAMPGGLPAYAGYVDGEWPSFKAVCERFYPRAHCISITTGLGNARFADVEAGDDTLEEAVYWLRDRVPVALGGFWTPEQSPTHPITQQWRPGLYIPARTLPQTLAEIARVMPKLDRSAICLWGAHWTDQLPDTLPDGLDALQCVELEPANYDVSVCGPRFLR